MRKISAVLFVMLLFTAFGATIYVNDNASGSNNGSSWANAYTLMQPALIAAVSGDEIWVAEGTYKPTYDYGLGVGDRGKHFRLKNGVSIYGGFNGTETLLSQRNFNILQSILSGDIGVPENNTDNTYHVIYHPNYTGIDTTAVLDGLTITGGMADWTGDHNSGAGIYNLNANPKIKNCTITTNTAFDKGGGIFENMADSRVSNCVITNNTAYGKGGGVCLSNNSLPVYTNCIVKGNYSPYGGGISVETSSNTFFYNCLIAENSAFYGGGTYNTGYSVARYINCTIYRNTAERGAGVLTQDNTVTGLTNSIIWGNTASIEGNQIYNTYITAVDNSCYSNSTGDIYNTSSMPVRNSINTNPKLISPLAGDYRISGVSPCINTGDNTYYDSTPYDLRGQTRIQNTTIDMGAYEWTDGIDQVNPIIYVNVSAAGLNNGSSWANAYSELQSALNSASEGYQIWVAAGTYKPSYDYGLGLGSRGNHFRMKNGVCIYGGFNGTETLLSQRNYMTNYTLLSGDIGIPIDPSDNCYHIFYHPDGLYLDNTAVLDGFQITNANADSGTAPHCYGAGMYNYASAPLMRNVYFGYNDASSGAGIYNEAGSAAQFFYCDFALNATSGSGAGIFNSLSNGVGIYESRINDNSAGQFGGGVYNFESDINIVGCYIYRNTAVLGGGAVCNDNSITALSNNLIVNNSSTNEGGGIMNFGSQTVITNCTISGNSTQAFGGGIYSSSSSIDELRNSIVWNNSSAKGGNEIYVDQYSSITLNYSCYGNDTNDIFDQDGNGFINSYANITDNPRLVNPAEFNFRVYGFSPCVNSGNDSYNVETMDVRDEARIQGGYIDMGAYEWTDGVDPANINAPLNVTIIVNASGDREITWSSVYEAYEYSVYRLEQPYGIFKKIGTTISNMYIDYEVPSGNKYFYYVTAESGK